MACPLLAMTSMTRMVMVELIAPPYAMDGAEMTDVHLAEVSALVDGAEDVAYLANQCRLVGVRDERAQTMRLLFEELVVGLTQGVISLKMQADAADAETTEAKTLNQALLEIADGQRASCEWLAF